MRFVRRIFTRTCETEGGLQNMAVLVRLVRRIFTRTCGTEGWLQEWAIHRCQCLQRIGHFFEEDACFLLVAGFFMCCLQRIGSFLEDDWLGVGWFGGKVWREGLRNWHREDWGKLG